MSRGGAWRAQGGPAGPLQVSAVEWSGAAGRPAGRDGGAVGTGRGGHSPPGGAESGAAR